jgi:large repetitive protein
MRSPLQATSIGTASLSGSSTLVQSDLAPIVNAAIDRWAQAGLNASALARLRQARFVLADLPGAFLGEAETNLVCLDLDAAGHGWFVDSTPASDEEFTPSSGSRQMRAISPQAVDRIDLLTVVEHELGHLIGLQDLDSSADSVMSGWLQTGVRELPQSTQVDALFAKWGQRV